MSVKEEIQEDFQIKYAINKWEKKVNQETKKTEIVFEIEMLSEISKKKWSVFHSMEEIRNLIETLSKICINIPECKIKKNSNEMGSQLINETINNFNNFIKNISYRSDIINLKEFCNFFELEKHFDKIKEFEPCIMAHLENLKYEIVDMVYLEKTNRVILACSKENSLINTGLDKIQFWKKSENKGEIMIFELKVNDDDTDKSPGYFNKVNSVSTENEISCLCLTDNKKYLMVGFFNGIIEVFDVMDDPSKESANIISSLKKIKVSSKNNKILNIGFNESTNYIYTACLSENYVFSSFLLKEEKVGKILASEDNLCGFCYSQNYNNLMNMTLTLDNKGRLLIGSIDQDNKNITLKFVILRQLMDISLFKVNWNSSHIYIGDFDGNIDIFEFGVNNNSSNPEIDKIINLSRLFSTILSKKEFSSKEKITNTILGNHPYGIKDVEYNTNKKEFYFGLNNGTVQIYSHFQNFAECVIPQNKKCITKLYFYKQKSILFTCSSEKDLYLFTIPSYYCTEMSRKIQPANLYNITNDKKICKNAIDKGYAKKTSDLSKKNYYDKIVYPPVNK